jgi:hypothetical protein
MATDANAAVASAKTALHNADNFGQRETGNKKAGDSAPAAAPSYSHARAARASSGLGSEVESAAAGLKARQDNVDQYVKSTE